MCTLDAFMCLVEIFNSLETVDCVADIPFAEEELYRFVLVGGGIIVEEIEQALLCFGDDLPRTSLYAKMMRRDSIEGIKGLP